MNKTHIGKLIFSSVKPGDGLKAALGKERAQVISEITGSDLKGRGGAGFPVGMKWNLAASAQPSHEQSKPETLPVGDKWSKAASIDESKKYVICNADEGEPGTFKDRVILSEFADLVFEGMTIAGYAIGSDEGVVYLRGEYAYLRPQLEALLANRRDQKLLGKSVGGKQGFDFDIRIQMGSGAYVCGEETALIESLEGHRGEPRNRPPFPVENGFMHKPTIVNNVETLAWVSCIMSKGSAWFKGFGTEKSAGLKLFSVSGDCDKPGVYEFPLGIKISELLERVEGRNAKGVQMGGASGHMIPAGEFNRKIAFEDVATGGSIIVFGQHRDMLEVAKNFLEFFVEESCGQCTPCREGNRKLLEGVKMLEQGRCSMSYLKELSALGETMQFASKCGLGQSSPNAFLSIVKHFKEDLLGRAAGKTSDKTTSKEQGAQHHG